jgi:hypothetical protein
VAAFFKVKSLGTSSPEGAADASPAERATLAQAKAKALARIAEIDSELKRMSGKGWHEQKSVSHQTRKLRREREVLTARLWLNAKGTALEAKSEQLIARSQSGATREEQSRKGPVGAVENFIQQMGASTVEAGIALGALTGRLAQLDGVSSAEHALLHPIPTAKELAKGVAKHVKDVYEHNGLAAAAGDVASLVLEALVESRLVGDALGYARDLTAPLPSAIAKGVARATGVSTQAALPVAQQAVNVLVAGEVAKEGIKLVAATASAEKVGVDVEERGLNKKA